ncbi:MAG: hypothetical protein BWK76_06905 [Desulfobulbaceae bacterium A2]|nr:MAG: hypothetical protein BWK76_06905 [Desulfobulbaceae bacterium A2]
MPGSQQRSRCRIACFVTPHGFGHATRAAAVLTELAGRLPIVVDIYGAVPPRLFAQSLDCPFSCRPLTTDVGFVQHSPVEEDLPATLASLKRLLPFDEALVETLAAELRQRDCRLVLCDIAALGIAVARRAGIPSVLVENFTWDWVYAGYLGQCPGLAPHRQYLHDLYQLADHRVQTEPVCAPRADAHRVGLICRAPRLTREELRRQLAVGQEQSLVLVTMGGIGGGVPHEALRGRPQTIFLLPGGRGAESWQDNLRLLPAEGRWYHPDLATASDLIVGKLGYSTLAEACQAGTPFAVIGRPHFPESAVLAEYAEKRLAVRELAADAFASGRWLDELPGLLRLERGTPVRERGAAEVAELVRGWLDCAGLGAGFGLGGQTT